MNPQREIAALREKLAEKEDLLRRVEGKLGICEQTVVAQRKEILALQRQLGSGKAKTATGEADDVCRPKAGSAADAQGTEARLHEAQTRNAALLDCVRKQNKLIDVLKRKLILAEAAVLVDLAERDLNGHLELDKSN